MVRINILVGIGETPVRESANSVVTIDLLDLIQAVNAVQEYSLEVLTQLDGVVNIFT
jgi:hypothetical protein